MFLFSCIRAMTLRRKSVGVFVRLYSGVNFIGDVFMTNHCLDLT